MTNKDIDARVEEVCKQLRIAAGAAKALDHDFFDIQWEDTQKEMRQLLKTLTSFMRED